MTDIFAGVENRFLLQHVKQPFLKITFALFIGLFLIWPADARQKQTSVADLKTEIEQFLDSLEGTFAVWFQHLDDENLHISINPDTLFHAASTMKTPVMAELFRRAESGDFDLADSIQVVNLFYSIVDGSEFQLDLNPDGDDPFERKVGEMATLFDLNHAMITYSSNIATNLILQLVGVEKTTETMRKLGAERIEVIRGLYDMKAFELGLNNRTTAQDLGIIFEKIARKKAVSPAMDELMIEVLKDQFYRDVFPVHLPDNVVVANKTGFITGVVHDSAIIFLPDGQSYVLIFLSKNLPDNQIGTAGGAEISRMIYQYLTQ
ncbi:MAG: serine hydrolase [Balneolaceae bacterium]|nr:MAG: serine hydrolase [Balneolaceae bacterium]